MNTVLFDLDGTLLPMDIDSFTKLYFSSMSEKLAHIIDSETLVKYIWHCTKTMVQNEDEIINEEVFMDNFKPLIGEDFDECKSLLDNYYENEFDVVKNATKENEHVIKSIALLKEKGYTLAIATNPIFPKEATLKRLDWTGLNRDDFIYMSNYEENCYCKPSPKYYNEVLSKIDKKPSECLMVGNDVVEDLAAKKVGVATYLITDNLLNNKSIEYETDYMGTYAEFYEFVKGLDDLNRGA